MQVFLTRGRHHLAWALAGHGRGGMAAQRLGDLDKGVSQELGHRAVAVAQSAESDDALAAVFQYPMEQVLAVAHGCY